MKWMTKPQTLNIGRFLLQMPDELQSRWQKYIYAGDQIETIPHVSLNRFNDIVRRRESELAANKRVDIARAALRRTRIHRLEKAVSPAPASRLLVFQEAFQQDRGHGDYLAEGHVWRDCTMFIFKSRIDDGRIQAAVADKTEKFQRIEARDNRTVPTKAGFSLDRGLMTGEQKFCEFAKAYFERPSTPGGAVFGIEMRPGMPSDDELLDRAPKLAHIGGGFASQAQTLRARDLSLGGLDGQEMLTRINSDGIAYYFIWEAKGEPESLVRPNTHIELRLGGDRNKHTNNRENAALNEEDVLELWDIILNSFHLRSGAI